MDTAAFYTTASTLCFTLLGFWWVVVQFRHDELTTDPGRRRLSFVVSLHFILPGLVSLASLIAGDSSLLWRLAFGLAGAAGLVAVIVGSRGVEAPVGAIAALRQRAWLAAPLYALITLVAAVPEMARSVTGLAPLQVEGYLLVLLVLLGILFAWALFTEPRTGREEIH